MGRGVRRGDRSGGKPAEAPSEGRAGAVKGLGWVVHKASESGCKEARGNGLRRFFGVAAANRREIF